MTPDQAYFGHTEHAAESAWQPNPGRGPLIEAEILSEQAGPPQASVKRCASLVGPLPTQAQFSGCPDSRCDCRRSMVRHGNSLFQAASLVSLGVWRVGRCDCRLAGRGDSYAGANLARNLPRERRSSAIRRCRRRLGVWPTVRRPRLTFERPQSRAGNSPDFCCLQLFPRLFSLYFAVLASGLRDCPSPTLDKNARLACKAKARVLREYFSVSHGQICASFLQHHLSLSGSARSVRLALAVGKTCLGDELQVSTLAPSATEQTGPC